KLAAPSWHARVAWRAARLAVSTAGSQAGPRTAAHSLLAGPYRLWLLLFFPCLPPQPSSAAAVTVAARGSGQCHRRKPLLDRNLRCSVCTRIMRPDRSLRIWTFEAMGARH